MAVLVHQQYKIIKMPYTSMSQSTLTDTIIHVHVMHNFQYRYVQLHRRCMYLISIESPYLDNYIHLGFDC